MEAPLIQWQCKDIKPMRRHYHPYEYNDAPSSEDDQQRRLHQPATRSYADEAPSADSRDRQASQTAPHRSSSTNRDHNSTPSFTYGNERSAFTNYSQNQQSVQRTPSPHMSPPAEDRSGALGFESPPQYHNPPRESAQGVSPYPYRHPSYQTYDSYEYAGYYQPDGRVDPSSRYQSWQPEEQEGSFHNDSSYHQDYNHYPEHSPYSYYSSPNRPPYQRQPSPNLHYHYHTTAPQMLHPSMPVIKQTPSSITDGTTPSSVARRGGGVELSPLDTAARSLLQESPSSNPSPPLDDRKPPAIRKSGDDESDDKRISAQGNLKTQSPHQDFEPIPLNEITTVQPPPPPMPYTPVASRQPLAPKVPSPPMPYTPVASRQPPQYRFPSIALSSSGSTASEGGSWDKRYNELLGFKGKFGHCDVPQNFADNTSLGIWVNKQRMEQKNRLEGKQSSMNDSRLGRLQGVGFRWAKRKGQASWDEKFNELVAYTAKFGNCHVPTKYKDNTALGRWVSTQRAEYKKFCEGDTKTSMNRDKIRRLESIGFAWFMAL